MFVAMNHYKFLQFSTQTIHFLKEPSQAMKNGLFTTMWNEKSLKEDEMSHC